jgi:hypothetical protein
LLLWPAALQRNETEHVVNKTRQTRTLYCSFMGSLSLVVPRASSMKDRLKIADVFSLRSTLAGVD